MPRDGKAASNRKSAIARRHGALARNELRQPSAPRQPPAGITSFPVKKIDMADAAAIEAFLSRDKAGQ